MDVQNSILKDVRESVGLSRDMSGFDTDLLMHINAAIVKLRQNGVGKFIVVKDDSTTWTDLLDPSQLEGNEYFPMIPLYISLSTKIIFDPPPPSAVELQSKNVEEMLWRLKVAYEK